MRQNNLTRADFDRLQQSYSRNYFELYTKYYNEKQRVKKALNFIYKYGNYDSEIEGFWDDITSTELIELKEILEGKYDNK